MDQEIKAIWVTIANQEPVNLFLVETFHKDRFAGKYNIVFRFSINAEVVWYFESKNYRNRTFDMLLYTIEVNKK